MIRAYVETDPAETEGPCWVIQIGRREFFAWWDRRPRFTTYKEPA